MAGWPQNSSWRLNISMPGACSLRLVLLLAVLPAYTLAQAAEAADVDTRPAQGGDDGVTTTATDLSGAAEEQASKGEEHVVYGPGARERCVTLPLAPSHPLTPSLRRRLSHRHG